MTAKAIFMLVGFAAAWFWVGVLFATCTLELAPCHNTARQRRAAAFNAAIFALFTAVLWWLP